MPNPSGLAFGVKFPEQNSIDQAPAIFNMDMKEFLISVLNFFRIAVWIEIITENPNCTYYFGPFLTVQEAAAAEAGYVEDLEEEGAQGIKVRIKRCKPQDLTIAEDLGKMIGRWIMPVFSSLS